MFEKARRRAQEWLRTQQDVILFAVVVALALYVIAFSIENKLARRDLKQRITTLEAKCK